MSKLNTDDRSAHSGYVPAGVVRIVRAGIDRSFSAIERQECSEHSVRDARKRLVSETGRRAQKCGLVRGSAGALAIMTAAKSLSEANFA
jgi:hypothetical protein